jgi:hypothetical protein
VDHVFKPLRFVMITAVRQHTLLAHHTNDYEQVRIQFEVATRMHTRRGDHRGGLCAVVCDSRTLYNVGHKLKQAVSIREHTLSLICSEIQVRHAEPVSVLPGACCIFPRFAMSAGGIDIRVIFGCSTENAGE